MIKYNSMLKQMIALTALMVSSIAFAQDREYVIVVHGGAGAMAGLEEDPVKSLILRRIGLRFNDWR